MEGQTRYWNLNDKPIRRLWRKGTEALTRDGEWVSFSNYEALWSEGREITQAEFDRLVKDWLEAKDLGGA